MAFRELKKSFKYSNTILLFQARILLIFDLDENISMKLMQIAFLPNTTTLAKKRKYVKTV
jgi:hypothetical protein